MSGECLYSVGRLSLKCFYECLVSDWKVFGGCMKRVSCKIYISNHFFVCKYLIRMVRTGWAKTGLVSSCLDMSGENILYQKFLDLNIFGIQNISGDRKILQSKNFDSELFWHECSPFSTLVIDLSLQIIVYHQLCQYLVLVCVTRGPSITVLRIFF